jgi:MFS family permease
MGVGGEWAVAASLVAEVFPPRARPHASGIFHASSVLGTWTAALVGMAVAAQWRYAYLLGILPALLIVWVRARVREPEKWQATAAEAHESKRSAAELGSFRALLTQGPWNRRALLGMALAAVGLGTFWAVIVAGQDLAREQLLRDGASREHAVQQAKFAYGIIQTAGGGLGLLAFGPICARIGRRRAFVLFQLLAFAIVPITCFVPQTYGQLLVLLPIFGFLTLAIHAGYAIYFPELFPTHLRATGASFCFNGGRVVAVPVLFLASWLYSRDGVDLRWPVTGLSSLFLVGVVLMMFLPETNRQELPE